MAGIVFAEQEARAGEICGSTQLRGGTDSRYAMWRNGVGEGREMKSGVGGRGGVMWRVRAREVARREEGREPAEREGGEHLSIPN